MSVSSVPILSSSLPQFSIGGYLAPVSDGPVLVLSHNRAFRNPKPYLDAAGEVATLRCEGVPADVPAGVQAIGRMPGMERVRSVEWSWKGPLDTDERTLIRLLEAPAFSKLDTLWLDGAPTTDGGVQKRSGRFLARLASADCLPSQHLHVAGLALDMEAIRTLRAWDGFANLLSWRLTNTEGGHRWTRFLATLPPDNQLRFLEISASDLGDDGLGALLARPLPHLKHLVLRNAGLTDIGAMKLLAWPGMKRLDRLDLGENQLSPETEAAFRTLLGPRLQRDR